MSVKEFESERPRTRTGSFALDRVEDLEEYISNFPDSPLVPIMEKEIEDLQWRL